MNKGKTNDNYKNESEVASIEEVRKTLENLNKADYVKLMISARYFANTRLGSTNIDPEDLLQDALLKTLDGRRRWNKRVSITKHLDRVMESDSGHAANKEANKKTVSLTELPFEIEDKPNYYDDSSDSQDALMGVLDTFGEDKQALDLIILKADGYKASEIMQQLGINNVEYATILRRIRRRITKYIEGS